MALAGDCKGGKVKEGKNCCIAKDLGRNRTRVAQTGAGCYCLVEDLLTSDFMLSHGKRKQL